MSLSLRGASRQLNWALGAAIIPGALLLGGLAHAQDAKRGQVLFNNNCSICHSVSRGTNVIGPTLFDVVGRKAGTAPGFNYSAALKASGLVWTPANLDTWLISPRAFVPMSRMSFAGLHAPNDRADVIAYLAKQK
jgi:cytochrome c